MASIAQQATEYVQAGLVLVPVHPGTKKPAGKQWHHKQNAINTPDKAYKLPKGMGLAHAWSRTCAIDIDHFSATVEIFTEHGIDLAAMLMGGAVQITSGRANRAKLIYRLPDGIEPLPTVKVQNGKTMLFELRCADKGGNTVMDVLPPSIHPDTGKPYTWLGDWHEISTLPDPLLRYWQAAAPRIKTSPKQSIRRTNISSRYTPVSTPHTGTHSATNATPELLQETDILKQVLPYMGFEAFDSLFTTGRASVSSPFRTDSHHSGGLIHADDGWVLFKDFKFPNITFTLARLWATLVTGEQHPLNKVSHAIWAMRLLIQAGVISPYPVRLPPFKGTPAEMKFYQGAELLLQCRWRYPPHEGKPVMMARDFMAGWCGISPCMAHKTKNKLAAKGVLKKHDSNKRGFLYEPFTSNQPRGESDE